jgi:hypothetical protein
MRKIHLLVFLVSLLLFSCVAAQENISTPTIPATAIPAVISTPVASTQVSTSYLIPKHNDLVFIEFFAVT